jgi:para-aminobenzoate synthetase/4-amino-4-deoxychorismate lyase
MKPASWVIQDERTGLWMGFDDPVATVEARTLGQVGPVLESASERVATEGLWAVGWVSYEAAPAFDSALTVGPASDFPLVWFGLFRAPRTLAPSVLLPVAGVPMDWQTTVSAADHREAIERIRHYIHAGDTYQVNYTRRLNAPFEGDPWALFTRLITAQKTRLGAFLDTGDWCLCSASPELFFRLEGDRLISRPMKGTSPRGLTALEDLELRRALEKSEKNRAENVMIVDMVRNDLGRVCEPGSVQATRLYDIEQYPTVWQMTSTVEGRIRGGVPEIFQALFPPASITGAPKRRTMEIITELESGPRSIYTGAVGFIAPGGRAQFNVAIRTVLIDRRRKRAEYGLGGGIVWDSTAAGEWEEGRVKARVLTEIPEHFDLLETLSWTPEGGFVLLEEHLDRLIHSARYFDRPADRAGIRARIQEAVSAGVNESNDDGRDRARPFDTSLRLRLRVDSEGQPSVEIQPLTPLPTPYRVTLALNPIHTDDRYLYHKTTRRAVYEQALRSRPGFNDVLLWNEMREITESCIANLIYEWEGRWYTPPVKCGLLPGVWRAALLRAGTIEERVLTLDEWPSIQRLELINSVRSRWPIECVFPCG